MTKMIHGTIACRISYAPDYAVPDKFYCDFCGKYFEDRSKIPCEIVEEITESPVITFEQDTMSPLRKKKKQ